ncbi:hypothetical protein DC429_00385 [Arthrobacter sp. TPD3018]|uniref:hypothetical protein n=1 Tax=Bacteria TaxID=2 RepID=UPI000D51729D|nr:MULTISPECIES: hypothetical protein [Bacteria]PVE58913.1 hypothetical protein DC425_00385 [Sphingomonas sp. TPD3009]PVE60435.1 hypothetical protein DC429_00385 [Arthrobacter sp. TPD3018]PVE87113.1 hypothetical protein DC431_00380 [Sphingomonas melonis]
MAKADRLEQLDARRLDLEAEYREQLVTALRATAAGKWGLFDHNADRRTRAVIAPVIDGLTETAEAIDKIRDRLALPAFELHRQFLQSRGPVTSHAVGEPKQAQAWLDRLSAESPDGF